MPFIFTCPHCQTKTQVEDRYSGMSGECVSCGRSIQIPQFVSSVRKGGAVTGKPNPFGWVIAASVVMVLLGCLVFAIVRFGGDTVQRLSNNRMQNTSMRNLQKIASALNAYAAKHGAYPPPAVLDPVTNKPMVSWRVLILPFLDEENLFQQYDLSKSWDAPENMQVTYQMPSVFRHPNAQSYAYDSDYYLIVGKNTMFPPTGPVDPKTMLDSPNQTILVCEGKPTNLTGMWTEPVDMDFAKMSGLINGSQSDDPGQLMDNGAAMATVDGRPHFLPDTTPIATFNALVTPNGGEPLADDTLD